MNKTQLIDSLKTRGFSKPILRAFEKVPREKFIPETLKKHAYDDNALPIGYGQTISQPYTISMMFSLLNLKQGQKVLEIGSGSGYALALMSEIVGNKGQVYGVEIVSELVDRSKQDLRNYNNIQVFHKNGSNGLPEKAPFDRILISAALPEVPKTILAQLKPNGVLVAPIGIWGIQQSLVAIKRFKRSGKTKSKFKVIKEIPGFVFVRFVE